MDDAITHDAAARRFTLMVDGHACVVDYRLVDHVMSITHTGVPEAVGGRGIAARLVTAALEFARRGGLKVRPACSYAEHFMRTHPEYDGLLAG